MNAPVNDRQVEVLRWIADGCPSGQWAEGENAPKISAAALKSRGLATVTGHGKTWTATITDTGKYYLEHGAYPPGAELAATIVPANRVRRSTMPGLDLSEGASATLAEAKVLIKRLQSEGPVIFADPDESIRARYRRILHACRTHQLVPAGQELRFTGRSSGDIVIMLSTGSPADATKWDRIRTTTRKVTTNLVELRSALESTSILQAVTEGVRPRAIEVVLGLVEELQPHGLRLG
ncbi:hypothetical protein G7066_08665 [Leucobacter coleopterorum]|uniref:Uncharacterized protein n=1 Tax=Leucobacter coleopterorum TaxID=2714933 RepID=A0ABX6JWP4_9MICO|nr:hypothetical protein [Leucobacter coleopterorum]QIM18663.1 hypothetical protein G7066_08665 [Leucobacter coleopterorum]